ncbi:MAG: S1C family serine protease [Candidatus Limnocylindria bacterium]
MTDPEFESESPHPIESDRYGASEDTAPIPARSDSWSSAPAWSTRRSLPVAPPEAPPARRPRLLGFVAIALAAGVVSGSLSGLAVVNLVGVQQPSTTTVPPGEQVSQVTLDETSAVINAVASVAPSVVTIVAGQATGGNGTGSGFIFDPDGWILTNRHVAAGAETLTVTLADSRIFDATLIGTDTLTDLAIIKIDATDLPTAPIGASAALEVGQLAIAIGYPLGEYRDTVTTGVVSGLGRQIRASDGTTSEDLNHLIQTDAAINPGNSGGPLVNSVGQVIGINTAVATSAQGIGFAIPIDFAKPIMALALSGQELARPWVGVWYTMITRQVAADLDLPVEEGALIDTGPNGASAVMPGSPGEAAGLQAGDIITALGGRRVDEDHDLATLLLPYRPGDVVALGVLRGGEELEIEVTLGTLPPR